MDATATEPFGTVLRAARLAAGWTQEALAERAGVSVRNIQSLEAGLNRPQRDTAQRPASALGLDEVARTPFLAAATPAPRHRTGLPAALADPSVARASPPTNLPLALTNFVGREREIAAVRGLLESTRLLTLTGTGGVGKTRLALQVAAELVDAYPDGVWLVELAAIADPALVPLAVAGALRLREEAGQAVTATLVAALQPRRLLLLLDNCEHVLGTCAAVAEVLVRACPQVQILATSREVLGLAGETAWRVPSLALPTGRHGPTAEDIAQVEAVRLFVERARAAHPHFALTAHTAPRWRRSAGGLMAFPWLWNWPPPGCEAWPSRNWSRAWTNASAC